ncbi:ComEC/Rec2 family competence protein [Granulicella cerasi]|uniref:ComEC/Rec2 family competence protein n=1 Tax=Granulicella cerasi TaxID=741063 RepID=A0ABW1Z6E3_9BACT|nr:MBL fold metallo-hydrolase [Granulicella cerasi]
MDKLHQLDRRTLLKSLAFASATSACPTAFGEAAFGEAAFGEDASLHQPLPAWSEGHFDIHHIDTARGNSTLLVFPDGTTMLIDAGAVTTAPEGTTNPARPNGTTLRPGQVLAEYILAHAPEKKLDYFLATHLHNDHVDGLADVAAKLPISMCIDRAFPHYAANQQPPASAKAYLDFLSRREDKGEFVIAANVGATDQITLRKDAARYKSFNARILAANGNVWNRATGNVDELLKNIPSAGSAHGYENNYSIATRFEYGAFSYYTGGDLNFDTFDGHTPALDTESPVARSCGRVEVAVANHHGYFDACGAAFTKALDAQAYVIPSWDIGHPGSAQMQRMMGAWDYTNNTPTHDVFALELLPQNALLNRRFAPKLKSQGGHVVVRVAPGGRTYTIYTLDSTVEHGNITGVSGPYTSRAAKAGTA